MMKSIGIRKRAGNAGRFGRCENGTAAVEFALCLPLMMVLLFFGIETGRLLVDFQTVAKSLRDSARYLSQVGITCPGTGTGPLSAYIDDAANETIARNLALTGTPNAPTVSSDYLLPYWTGAGNLTMTVSCVSNGGTYQGTYEGVTVIPQITVSAAVPFAFMWGTVFAASSSLTINLSHTQSHMGA